MKEKWIKINTIEGYEEIKDYYWISNTDEDKIVNRNTGRILKPCLDKDGYKAVYLQTINGKQKNCYLHILKAKAFIYGPIPLGANVVRHLNDCKIDNRLENLAWGSYSDNIKDSIRNGRFNYQAAAKNGTKNGAKTGAKNGEKYSKSVRCIETNIIYPSAREAERQTGINNGSIGKCCLGKRMTAGGYHWEFVDKEMK